MKARILDNSVVVHLSTDETSPEVQRLALGAEVELGRVLTYNAVQWVEVLDGTFVKGFIRGDTKVYFIKKMIVDQDEMIVYDMAAPTALEKARYIKGTILYTLDETKVAEQDWIQVRDENGNVGFIHKDTVLKDAEPAAVPPPPPPGAPYPGAPFPQTPEMREAIRIAERKAGRNQMLLGALMFVAGCAVTALTYSSASTGGGYYWLCFGPIIFGPVYFFQGLAKYNRNK
jgi:hypothetical protein